MLDEFGKGTCSFDGAALLAATLEHLVAGGCGPCPRVVASTHLVEIFDVLRRDFDDGAAPRIRVAEMRVEFDDRNPVPLFRLREGGVSRDSYGAACARRVGVPEHVVRRAEQLAALAREGGNRPDEEEPNAAFPRLGPAVGGALQRVVAEVVAVRDWTAISDVALDALLTRVARVSAGE